MNSTLNPLPRAGALLAINLLFLVVWGFASLSKLLNGMPSWFGDKFGQTMLARLPGLTATFWLLALAEVLAFALAVASLGRLEFLRRPRPVWLTWMLVVSLFVFVMLGFGQWLTSEFNGTAQLFAYFAGTLVALQFVGGAEPRNPGGSPGN